MKHIALLLVLCLLLTGCAVAQVAEDAPETKETVAETTTDTTAADTAVEDTTAATDPTEAARVVSPLPDATMENLTDAILSISLEEGGAYVDDTGAMQMDLKIYTYDRYDMVDIAALEVGDFIVRYSGVVDVTSVERTETGMVLINGGLENDGFDLVTDESGTYFEVGYNDHKNWYEIGEATIRVSADLTFTDKSDLEQGEMIFFAGSFLVGEVTNYDFTPYNTTVRVENGQIIEMERRFIP